MKKNIFLQCVGLTLLMVVNSGCFRGLAVWEKGKYFQTEVASDAKERDLETVGVYCFSDGEAMNATYSFNGFSASWWPREVRPGVTFYPDTTNSGPSLELATAIASELNDRGYVAKAVSTLGHGRDITIEEVLQHAKENGYDAAFITSYKGLTSWSEITGITTGYRSKTIHVGVYEGYLFLPNSGFFDLKKGDQVWKSSYYGIVENATLPNLVNSPFVEVATDQLVGNGEENYVKSAPKAAEIIFKPSLWPESFKEFPAKEEAGSKKRKM